MVQNALANCLQERFPIIVALFWCVAHGSIEDEDTLSRSFSLSARPAGRWPYGRGVRATARRKGLRQLLALHRSGAVASMARQLL
jgi:hypothetical protein